MSLRQSSDRLSRSGSTGNSGYSHRSHYPKGPPPPVIDPVMHVLVQEGVGMIVHSARRDAKGLLANLTVCGEWTGGEWTVVPPRALKHEDYCTLCRKAGPPPA